MRGLQSVLEYHDANRKVDFSLRTFAIYIRSAARALRGSYGDDEGLLIAEILSSVKQANPRPRPRMERVESSLRRAWSTERLLRRTYDVGADPNNKADSLPWLPTQSYYAIHAALDALLETHYLATESHQAALNSFASTISPLLPPFPLGVSCEGFEGNWVFQGFPSPPSGGVGTRVGNDVACWCTDLAAGLRTTRNDDAQDDIAQWKSARGKKKIPKNERDRIVGRKKKTTLLHLLWRLRRRASYGDIELFLNDAHRQNDLLKLAAGYVWLTSCLIASFEALIERRIGFKALEQIIRRFPDDEAGPSDFVARRWRLS